MPFKNDDDIAVLDLIIGIVDVMEEDHHGTITRNQVELMGNLSKGHIQNGKQTTDLFLEICDLMKYREDLSLAQIKYIGGIVLKAQKENKNE